MLGKMESNREKPQMLSYSTGIYTAGPKEPLKASEQRDEPQHLGGASGNKV